MRIIRDVICTEQAVWFLPIMRTQDFTPVYEELPRFHRGVVAIPDRRPVINKTQVDPRARPQLKYGLLLNTEHTGAVPYSIGGLSPAQALAMSNASGEVLYIHFDWAAPRTLVTAGL
jgi:hypothetical protein